MKPRKFCNHAGCNKLIPFNETYCDKHKQDSKKSHDATDNKARSTRVHHSQRWRKLSLSYRKQHPICEQCLKDHESGNYKGIPRLATSVDHIIPLFKGGQPYSEDNLQALCNICHNKKSLAERRERL